MDKVDELTDVLLMKGMIPRYKADMTPDPKGRTFMFEYEGETLLAKKRDDVYVAMRECPKIQEYFLEKLKAGETDPVNYEGDDEFESMSEDEFEASLLDDSSSEAEEVESSWEEL